MPNPIVERIFGVALGTLGTLGALGAVGAVEYCNAAFARTTTFFSGAAFAVACLALARAEFAVRIARAGLDAPTRPSRAEERSVRALHDLVQHFVHWWSTVASWEPPRPSTGGARVDDERLHRDAYRRGQTAWHCPSEAGSDESELVRTHATVDPNEWVHAALRASTPLHEPVSDPASNASTRRRLPEIAETRLSHSPIRVR